MNNSISVVVFGRLGVNPELKYTAKQEPVCTFSIAEQRPESEKTIWHKIVVWGKRGEDCKLYLKKGSAVFVRGRIQRKEFQTEEGLKNYNELKAELVGFTSV